MSSQDHHSMLCVESKRAGQARRPLAAAAVATGLLIGLAPSTAEAQSCNSGAATTIDQHGVAVTFDQSYTCGTFANGDYWVVPTSPGGTVTIQSMIPAFNGTEHGFEVNPSSIDDQGFDSRAHNFDAGRVPALPYVASGDQSVVKAISVATADVDCRPCLDTAIVLTVLDSPPTGNGAGFFRPPYFATDKPLIETAALRPELLPSLAPPGDEPSLADTANNYERVQLDHQNNWIGRAIHPVQNMPDYGTSIGRRSGDAVLRLMLDDSEQDKMPALVNFVQFGIDLYYMMRAGQSWPANGGHHNGRKIAMAFAAALLDDATMKADVMAANDGTFGEDGIIVYSDVAGRVLWGQECSEQMYWQNQTDSSGSRTCRDPYSQIDGGETPGESYQGCCNSGMWKGTGLALFLMDELRCLWNNEHFLTYLDRWVEHGAWSQPDTCAPSDGNWSNYGVTFGPDGADSCIQDTEPTCTAEELTAGASAPCTGRWPGQHGASQDGGGYTSDFHIAMWTAYRSQGSTDPPNCDGTGGGSATGGGTATGGGGTGGSGATGGAGGTPSTGATPEDDGGCGCRVPSNGSTNGAPWWLLGLAGVWLRRSRRR